VTRVLVTGAGGQIGREVVAACAGDDVIAADRATLDVNDRDAVLQSITSTTPDVIVHAGAWTAVDACEGDPDRAFRVNALGTRHVAEGARRVGAWVCYLSTDYVFDGTKPEPYVEWDAPNPMSVYGRSKLGGESELDAAATIVRTSWVCGRHGNNMVKTILRLAGEHEKLTFVDDQRGQPSFADDLAPMIRRLAVDRRPGVFHVTNQGAVSWYEFARAVLEVAGLDPERVRPIPTADLDPPRPAPRPANSVLDNAALRLGGIPLLPHFRDALARLVRQLQS
jgi:dTDP-4-dehydrorhamnose reductase